MFGFSDIFCTSEWAKQHMGNEVKNDRDVGSIRSCDPSI